MKMASSVEVGSKTDVKLTTDLDLTFSPGRDDIYEAIVGLPLVDPRIKERVATIGEDYWPVRDVLRDMYNLDEKTFRHVVNAGALALHLADVVFGIGSEDRDILATATLMHDAGKTAVDRDIIQGYSKLTPAERRAIEMHPEAGFLRATYLLRAETNKLLKWMVPRLVLTHHHDNGYPNSESMRALTEETDLKLADLENEKLLYLGRPLTAADVFDAITSGRNYNKDENKDPADVRRILSSAFPNMPRAVGELMKIQYHRLSMAKDQVSTSDIDLAGPASAGTELN